LSYKLNVNDHLKKFSRIFFILLIALTITGVTINKNIWGYYFKRPATFCELKNTNQLLSITQFEINPEENSFRISSDTTLYDNVKINPDYYYDQYERPLKSMFSEWESRGNLIYWKEIYFSKTCKISERELKNLYHLISASGFQNDNDKIYLTSENNLTGVAIEFITSNVRNVSYVGNKQDRKSLSNLASDGKYIFVTLSGGEISNDTYPVYEFLIRGKKIIKRQRYFYDVAGIEGLEYSIIAPYLEILLLIISLAIFGHIRMVKYLKGKNKKMPKTTP
jgi:hypothetical protein